MGYVIQQVYHIETQEQLNRWLVFSNRVGKKIRGGPDGLNLPDAITGVGGNDNDSEKTDVRKESNDGE